MPVYERVALKNATQTIESATRAKLRCWQRDPILVPLVHQIAIGVVKLTAAAVQPTVPLGPPIAKLLDIISTAVQNDTERASQ